MSPIGLVSSLLEAAARGSVPVCPALVVRNAPVHQNARLSQRLATAYHITAGDSDRRVRRRPLDRAPPRGPLGLGV